jgi:hypothetical protein
MARRGHTTAFAALLSVAVWTADARERDETKPDVILRASPRISLAPPGGLRPVILTAEIVGPETEKYYCPEIVWIWPDGTHSSEESDCAPFEIRTDYPRRFNRRIAAPAFPRDYRVCIVLRKGGALIDKSCAKYAVR